MRYVVLLALIGFAGCCGGGNPGLHWHPGSMALVRRHGASSHLLRRRGRPPAEGHLQRHGRRLAGCSEMRSKAMSDGRSFWWHFMNVIVTGVEKVSSLFRKS
jgi:hypothetical protein